MKSAFFHQRRLLTGATFHMVKRREPGTRLEGLDFCGGITIETNSDAQVLQLPPFHSVFFAA